MKTSSRILLRVGGVGAVVALAMFAACCGDGPPADRDPDSGRPSHVPPPTPMSHDELLAPARKRFGTGDSSTDSTTEGPWRMLRQNEGRARLEWQRWERNYDLALAVGHEVAAYRAGFGPSQEVAEVRRRRMERERAEVVVTRLGDIVADREAAAALGKMWFWEMRAGSDGQTACASCHYQAGADPGLATRGAGALGADSVGVASRLLAGVPAADDDLEPAVEFTSEAALALMKRRYPSLADLLDRAEAPLEERRARLAELTKLDLADLFRATKDAVAERRKWRLSDLDDSARANKVLERAQREVHRAFRTLQQGGVNAAEELLEACAEDVIEGCELHEEEHAEYARRLGELVGRLREVEAQVAPIARTTARGFFRAEMQHLAAAEGGADKRQSTGRNAGSVIDAVSFDRLFHDGRAQSTFNGYDQFGDDAERDGIGKYRLCDGHLQRVLVRIPHAALASQAVVPLLSAREMSWYGRQFHHVARKLVDSRPLRLQQIARDDSLLAPWLDADGHVRGTYRDLIERAFRREWWAASARVRPGPDGEHESTTGAPLELTQIEANFSLFWGIALQLYQERLVSDQSPFDVAERAALDPEADPVPRDPLVEQGLDVLRESCVECHTLPEFSNAARSHVLGPLHEFGFDGPLSTPAPLTDPFRDWYEAWVHGRPLPDEVVEWMPVERGPAGALGIGRGQKPYDNGFYNIGVTEAHSDPGIGVSSDVPGRVLNDQNAFGNGVPEFVVRSWVDAGSGNGSVAVPRERSLSFARRRFGNFAFVQGAFKTPGLRNLRLTGPWFHDGSGERLAETLDVYADPPFEDNEHLHPSVPIEGGLSDSDREALLALFEHLVDPRVESESAPFDHPSLAVPNTPDVSADGTTPASGMAAIPAIGREGR